jgi:hypothetical protein
MKRYSIKVVFQLSEEVDGIVFTSIVRVWAEDIIKAISTASEGFDLYKNVSVISAQEMTLKLKVKN